MLKKCVKLPDLAHQLVKESGLLLWLSSVMSIFSGGSDGTESSCSRVTELTLEVKQQQHSLFSQASWGSLEMKPERNKFKVQAH